MDNIVIRKLSDDSPIATISRPETEGDKGRTGQVEITLRRVEDTVGWLTTDYQNLWEIVEPILNRNVASNDPSMNETVKKEVDLVPLANRLYIISLALEELHHNLLSITNRIEL